MRKIFYWLVLLSLAVALSAWGREVSLKEALALSENHSLRLKAAEAQTRAFDQSLRAAVAARMPILSASGKASYRDEVPQLEIELPTGEVFRRDFGFEENYQVDLRLTLPLFTGGRVGGGIDLARATRNYYKALESAGLDEVLLLTRTEYFSLYKAERLVEAGRAGLKRAQVIVDDVQSLYDAGAADSVSLLDARLALAEAESRVTNAVSSRRQNEIRLTILLGLDPGEQILLTTFPAAPDSAQLSYQSVLKAKPELMAAASAVDISRSSVKLSRADLYPGISVFGGYSWGKPNIDPFHDEFNDYFIVGAGLTWSFNVAGGSVRNLARSKRQLSAAQYEYEKTAERLDRNARLAFESLKLTYDNYRTAERNHQIASDNYRLAGVKHRQGVLSANRLIEIETTLSQAEASLASTRADFYIVQSQFYRAVGSDLLKEGI